ncbi:expressed unknown protein [Seminavis robusta]|uniref:DUF6824 domain-containing protein n=1 Tax=Seminavis robusta TaxID=568900 RepID=A0A9N8ECI9_9STRA|nr:expressed unknown protein [Seminavis robusta]|eukprot:Sro890_g216720.1 n/a (305) ;mRNA; r:19060-20074
MADTTDTRQSTSLPLIYSPTQTDILCGKTKQCMLHPGTQRFRLVIESFRDSYAGALTKFDKMCVTKQLVDLLNQASARFLKYNNKEKAWEELSSLQARDKVGHALRFANRITRKAGAGVGDSLPSLASVKQQPAPSCSTSRIALIPAVIPMIKTSTTTSSFSLNQVAHASITKLHSEQVLPTLQLPMTATSLVAASLPLNQPARYVSSSAYSDDARTSSALQGRYEASMETMSSTMRLAGETVALLNTLRSCSSIVPNLPEPAKVPDSQEEAPLEDDFLSFPMLEDDSLGALDGLTEVSPAIFG